jgi:hypothetical protein
MCEFGLEFLSYIYIYIYYILKKEKLDTPFLPKKNLRLGTYQSCRFRSVPTGTDRKSRTDMQTGTR